MKKQKTEPECDVAGILATLLFSQKPNGTALQGMSVRLC